MDVFVVGGVEVVVDDTSVQWLAGLTVDADGCPRAYRLDDGGLDNIKNARNKSGRWVGVVVDAAGNPIVQGPGDPAPGFLVSPTASGNHTYPEGNPRRYVDADVIPYMSIPPELEWWRGSRLLRMGDVGVASYRGVIVEFVLADVGPHDKLGEGSMALARALGMDPSPRHGGAGWGVSVVVYRGSSIGFPSSVEQIKHRVAELRAPQVL